MSGIGTTEAGSHGPGLGIHVPGALHGMGKHLLVVNGILRHMLEKITGRPPGQHLAVQQAQQQRSRRPLWSLNLTLGLQQHKPVKIETGNGMGMMVGDGSHGMIGMAGNGTGALDLHGTMPILS